MSEVEKMYKNAGIEPKYKDYRTKNGKTYEDKNPNNRNIRLLYPEFTAGKQIKLFLFVTSLGVCEIEDWKEKGFYFAIKRKNIYPTTFLSLSNINFEETLADIINNLWQDLTESEQEQIRRIL